MRAGLLAAWLGLGCTGPGPQAATPPPELEVWAAAGEPRAGGLVLWARSDGPAWVQGEVRAGERVVRTAVESTRADHDHTVHLPVDGLPTAERWQWVVRAVPQEPGLAPPFLAEGATVARGEVPGPPPHDAERSLRLALGGDLAGQEHCPEPGGSRILRAVVEHEPDVFLANGDMIYADGRCPPHAPDGRRNRPAGFGSVADPRLEWTDEDDVAEVFFAHWRHNWADRSLRALQARAFYVGQWDDHEVINDFGASWTAWHTKDPGRRGYPTLVRAGRRAFAAYTPGVTDERVHRALRWGRHVSLLVVDARSHRSPNHLPDGPAKTLLGAEQRDWLAGELRNGDTTWTLVSLDVPLSIPTGSAAHRAGRDGVASGTGDAATPPGAADLSASTGFEHELRGILREADAADRTGLVFLSTDVHFPRITRYEVDLDSDGELLVFHEVVAGPLRAWLGQPTVPDPSFGPTVLFEAGGVANFALIDIEGPELTARIVGENGKTLPGGRVELAVGR